MYWCVLLYGYTPYRGICMYMCVGVIGVCVDARVDV